MENNYLIRLCQKYGEIFSEEARKDYQVEDINILIDDLSLLSDLIVHFMETQYPRLRVLKSYQEGKNYGIMTRKERRNKNKSDYRIHHNFGGYISDFYSGYETGTPVKVEHNTTATQSIKEKDSANNDPVKEAIDQINELNNANMHNTAMAKDSSIYGRAFEINWRNEKDEDRFAKLSVFETFVIRDRTPDKNIIGAVTMPTYMAGSKTETIVRLYTKDKTVYFKPVDSLSKSFKLEIERVEANIIGKIPVTEWRNNDERIGDYELLTTLIDAYDYAQSDTANYMHDLNDAMLVINGDDKALGNFAEDTTEIIEIAREANILYLRNGVDINGQHSPASAYYLYKQYDYQGKEVYLQRLEDNIHKFACVPNLSDENFAGNTSGIAMEYKLMGSDQVLRVKTNFHEKAIKERYEIINARRLKEGTQELDPNNLIITFTPHIPEDVWGEIKFAYDCGASISQKTMISQLSFIKSADDEIKQRNQEYEEQTGLNTKVYDFEKKLDELNQVDDEEDKDNLDE